MVQIGQDPHIPEEGTELLTDEEALEQIYREHLPVFRKHVAYRYLAGREGYVCTREEYQRAQDAGEVRESEPLILYEYEAYMVRGIDILTAAAEKYLED